MTSGEETATRETFKFPECWNNDVRMSSLFAPFRSKSVNPTDWDSKMKFWVNLIENWCKHTRCPLVEISSLKKSFSRKGLTPACLEDVLQHMTSTGILIIKDNFMAMDDSWKNWAIKILVTNPLKWTFNTVKSTIIKDDSQKEVYYVHMPVVKHLGEELLKSISSLSNRAVIKYEDLLKCGIQNPDDLSLIMHWLQKQGKIAISMQNEQTLVKFSNSNGKEIKITETDLGIYSLEKQQTLLEDNIRKLETERNAALDETKRHLAAKMKSLAKISLRRKNVIEKAIEKRAVMLENIQGILHSIDQAKLDTEVISSYQKGIATLRQVYKESGLTQENVTDTMTELEEILNSRSEIEEALAKPMDPSVEEDVEDELNALLLQDAPEVPKNDLPPVSDVEKGKERRSKPTEDLETRLEALSI